jgi:hypothetical protein
VAHGGVNARIVIHQRNAHCPLDGDGMMDAESFVSSMIAGACGYVVKPSSPAATISAVKKALNGQPALCVQAEATIIKWLRSLAKIYLRGA